MALKATPGGDILTTGSTTLVQSLLRAGLVDELHLLIHPVVVGEGRRLFEQDNPLSFTLGESAALPNGVVHAVYRPVSAN